MALASELSLPVLLQRIVELAAEITGAGYGALGVIGPGGDLVDFLTTGITDAEIIHVPFLHHCPVPQAGFAPQVQAPIKQPSALGGLAVSHCRQAAPFAPHAFWF